LATCDLLILDVVSPRRASGGPSETSRAQIVILPMTDADLAPTRALYVMGAPLPETSASADAPHRWCATRHHRLQVRAGEPVLASAPLIPAPSDHRNAHEDETASETRGPMARARFRVIEGGLS
jgi:hypothetical protein